MSNMKKRRSVLFMVVAVVTIVFASFFISLLVFVTGHDKGYHPDPDSWVGLTKGEFLDLAFKEFPACRGGELYVIVKETTPQGKKNYDNYSFLTSKDAKADSDFMKYDIWIAEIQIRSSFLFSKRECVVLKFVDDRVVKAIMSDIGEL